MFFTTAIPQTVPPQQGIHDWKVPQSDLSPLAQILAEARQTNALLASILAALPIGSDPATKPEDLSFNPLALMERVEWLERQVAELKERQ